MAIFVFCFGIRCGLVVGIPVYDVVGHQVYLVKLFPVLVSAVQLV